LTLQKFDLNSPPFFFVFLCVLFWYDNRIPGRQIPKLVVVDVLFVISLQSAKEWLLDLDIGVFWVVMRVLACGGLGVLGWEMMTQQVMKRKNIEVCVLLLMYVSKQKLTYK